MITIRLTFNDDDNSTQMAGGLETSGHLTINEIALAIAVAQRGLDAALEQAREIAIRDGIPEEELDDAIAHLESGYSGSDMHVVDLTDTVRGMIGLGGVGMPDESVLRDIFGKLGMEFPDDDDEDDDSSGAILWSRKE